MQGKSRLIRNAANLSILCLSLMLAGCSQPQLNQSPATIDPTTWLKQNAIPLKTTDPGGSYADLHALPNVVGNASVVGLGEETHGTHEFVDMKVRIIEYLVTHQHFTALVMENPWARSKMVDDYINGGDETPLDLMNKDDLRATWDTEEFINLLQWMRTYNADPSHTTKLHFYGMDCVAETKADFNAVTDYISGLDPANGKTVQAIYTRIATTANQDFQSLPQYQTQAQQVVILLQQHQQTYTAHSSADAFALTLQNAQVIVQFLTCGNSNTNFTHFIQRDAFMAANAIWIHDHLAGANRMIVWAHDAHIADDTAYQNQNSTVNTGHLLRQQFATSYLAVGMSLFSGTFTTINGTIIPYHASTSPIPSVDPSSYNATLGGVGLSPYMVDLRKVPTGSVARWANGYHAFLNLGFDGTDLSTAGSLKQWFDVIIHVQNTTPTHIISNAVVTTS
jgi:erythromycin esterase